MRVKKLADGRPSYFWQCPQWALKIINDAGQPVRVKRHGRPCPVESQPLGANLSEAILKADNINAIFDSWMQGETKQIAHGTVAWLFSWYRKQDRYTSKTSKTRRDYHRIMDRICDEPVKVGKFGEYLARNIDAAAADKLYARFKKRGDRMGAYTMQVCRLVWTWAVRYKKTTGVTENPFLRMGISTKVKEGNRETSREEYNLYRETAREMGFQSMATAAALSFELCQRVWDVFGFVDEDGAKRRGFVWPDYRAGESFSLRQSKTNKVLKIPLYEIVGRGKVALYPELEAELKRTERQSMLIIVEERSGLPYTERRMSNVHRAICNKAGLPKKMTFTGFRHGGATELGDAGVEDMRSVTGHDLTSTTKIYNKANERKARAIGLKRRKHIALLDAIKDQENSDLLECDISIVGMEN